MSLVLIADDEEALVESMSDVVSDLGHEPLRAFDGQSALLLARSRSPQLIVTDYMMPKLNGLQLIRELRNDPALAEVPVILMSAARPRGVEGVHAFLAKPVALESFEGAVRKALADRHGASPANSSAIEADTESGNSSSLAVAREEMLNWVAHEIKTPLGTAKMAAEILIRRSALAGEPADLQRLELIVRQLDRMNDLVVSVLDAARLGSNQLRLKLETGDLREFLGELTGAWRERAPSFSFGLSLPPDPVMVSYDPEQLRRILDNLVSNAVKFGMEARSVEIALLRLPSSAEITVTDRGPGIDAAEVSRVFDRFHTVKSNGGRGHGLGLFIASTLARLHGGALTAESIQGQGATFRLRLPLAHA